MGADNPAHARRYPYLTIAMAVLHRPGAGIAEAGVRALRSIRDRGYPAGWLAADNAYTNAIAEKFQLPVRALGYRLVLSYNVRQVGAQGSFGGAIFVEGAWYCASMPQTLIDATLDYLEGRIEEDVWLQRINARTAYLLRLKARADEEGHIRLMCPAAGTAPTVRCDLKPDSRDRTKGGTTRVILLTDVSKNPPKVCVQQTMTFPPEIGAKFAQELQYGTDEWHSVYASLRNTIEGLNGVAKDPAFEAIGTPSRHRIRGVAAQTAFAAFALFGTNMRKIDTFETNAVVGADGELYLPKKRRRRETKSLNDFLPVAAEVGADGA
jgi:hypothetical protein